MDVFECILKAMAGEGEFRDLSLHVLKGKEREAKGQLTHGGSAVHQGRGGEGGPAPTLPTTAMSLQPAAYLAVTERSSMDKFYAPR